LRATLPLRLALPALEPVLAENVAKEARKDALVIACAAKALAAGAPPGADAVRQILAAGRGIDREFLAQAGRLPVRIEIPYERIEPLRLRRIELGLELAHGILEGWQQGKKLRRMMPPDELERRLCALLQLYADETRALSQSVRLPGFLAPVRERIAERLHNVLSSIARSLSREVARAVAGASR
jgi:hypothetical protein